MKAKSTRLGRFVQGLIVILTALFATVAFVVFQTTERPETIPSVLAWSTHQTAKAICVHDHKAAIDVTFQNTEPIDEMDVIATDLQTGKSVDLGTVLPGETVPGRIETGQSTLAAGTVRFDLEWTYRSGRDQRFAEYEAVDCEPPAPPPEWQWDYHFDCNYFKVSSLNNSDSPVKAEAWIWDGVGNQILYYGEIVQPAADAWFNAIKDTPLNYTGHVTGRIVLSNPRTGYEITRQDFATEKPLMCEPACVNDGLLGFLNYDGNHPSGLPVTGEVWNPSENACEDVAYMHVFGSMHLDPEGPSWLEEQDYVTSLTIPVPEGNQHVSISETFDNSEYCWYQVDLTPTSEVRVPPYYSGGDMIDYVFVQGKPCPPPTGSVSVDKIDEEGNPWEGVTIELLKDNEVINSGTTPVTFSNLELGNYVVREIVPEGSEPIGPTQYEFTINEEHLSFEFTFQNRRPKPLPCGDCEMANASMTWEYDDLIITGEIRGFGKAWKITGPSGIVASGEGSRGRFEFRVPWEKPKDVKIHYQGWILGFDDVWRTSSDCDFKPSLECPECGPQYVEHFGEAEVTDATPEDEVAEVQEKTGDGFELVFSADHCSVEPCNTLVLTTQVMLRGFHPAALDYKGELLTPNEVLDTLAGTVYVITTDFTWLEDGKNFVLLDESGEHRLRDVYGQKSVEKSISCSLTVGLYDITVDGVAIWRQPQTVWDWQWFLIREAKVFGNNNSQAAWDQAGAWARELMEQGELSLEDLDLDKYGKQSVDLSGLFADT